MTAPLFEETVDDGRYLFDTLVSNQLFPWLNEPAWVFQAKKVTTLVCIYTSSDNNALSSHLIGRHKFCWSGAADGKAQDSGNVITILLFLLA